MGGCPALVATGSTVARTVILLPASLETTDALRSVRSRSGATVCGDGAVGRIGTSNALRVRSEYDVETEGRSNAAP